MESRQESHDRYVGKLEEHLRSTRENVRYSTDRFDILIISLSTSALVLSIGFVKDILKDFSCIDKSCLKFSWLLFVLSLIANLISQVFGYLANEFDIRVTTNMIREERGNKKDENADRNTKFCTLFSMITQGLNLFSLACLIIGITVLINFISNNF